METHIIYCSACDRDVQVVFNVTPEPPETGGAEVDPSGICIDYCTHQCTGSSCALFDIPSSRMAERLRTSGIIDLPSPEA